MKKVITAIATIIIFAGILAACEKSESPKPDNSLQNSIEDGGNDDGDYKTTTAGEEKQKVTMWFWGATPEQQDLLNRNLVAPYNNSQNGYELVLEYRSSVDEDIAVALTAGEGPDIVYGSGPAFIKNYAEAGRLANLDEYAEAYGWEERLLPPVYNTGFVKDSLYSLPSAMYCAGLFYNKELMDEHGWAVPNTIDELTKVMDQAQKEGLQSMLFGISGWKPSMDIVASIFMNVYAGPDVFYDCLTGKEKFNSEKMVQAIDISREWYEKGYFTEDMYALSSSDCAQMLLDGAAPFALSGSSGYQRMANFFLDGDQEKVGFIPFPSINGSTEYILATTATWSINANSECKDAAAEILNTLESEGFMQGMTGVWPGYWTVALNDFSQIKRDNMSVLGKQSTEVVIPLAEAVAEGRFGYYSSTFLPSATATELTNIDTVWLGETTAQEFMDHVAFIFGKELAEGLVPKVEAPKR